MKRIIVAQTSRPSGVALCARTKPLTQQPAFTFFGCLSMAVLAFTLFAVKASAVDSVIHNFAGAPGDGSMPQASLVSDQFGNLYGTTAYGGTNNFGTVFVECAPLPPASPDLPPCVSGNAGWVSIVLYNFRGIAFSDGANPTSTLIFGGKFAGRAFTLYGTTWSGGVGGNCSTGGCGTVFELCAPAAVGGCGGPLWVEHVLYSFIGGGFDGENPFAGVIKDKNDNLYGTTVYGGGKGKCLIGGGNFNCGTVFKLTPPPGFAPPWPEKIMHRFAGAPVDGANPYGALCCNSNAGVKFLYGTTVLGGKWNNGTVFKLKNVIPAPALWLYSFTGGVDGANPYGNVVLDAAGNLYGSASNGGGKGTGTLFELPQPPPPAPVAPLYTFCSAPGCTDGANPVSGPTLSGGTKLFGTTFNGGAPGFGTVYDFTIPGAVLVQQHAFNGPGGDGAGPFGGIVTDPVFPGNWYGTTLDGGGFGLGIVYQIP